MYLIKPKCYNVANRKLAFTVMHTLKPGQVLRRIDRMGFWEIESLWVSF